MPRIDEIPATEIATRERIIAPPQSAISWAAILGGATAGAAVSLILLSLGAGFGLAVVSPFGAARHETTLETSAIIWLLVSGILSSALGGYLAGRLRTLWTGIHADEAHFRDTAHGFLSWAVAAVLSAAFLGASAVTLAGAPAAADRVENLTAYRVDTLLRAPNTKPPASDEIRNEVGRLFDKLTMQPDDEDRLYLSRLVSDFAGLPPADASARVDALLLRARQVADAARKETGRVFLWMALALLMGAFISSHAATVGGRQRGRVPTA